MRMRRGRRGRRGMARAGMHPFKELGSWAVLVTVAALYPCPAAAAARTSGEAAAARWVDDSLSLHSLGHHRVRVKCPAGASPAAFASLEWRRPDAVPAEHAVYVTTDPTTVATVRNAVAVNVSRLNGVVAFDTQSSSNSSEFYVYWLPFTKNHLGQWGAVAVSYDRRAPKADPAWVVEHVADGRWRNLPRCIVLAYEARDSFNRFTAMEVETSSQEMAQAVAAAHSAPFLVFPEDRDHPVREFERLPARWLPLVSALAAGRCQGGRHSQTPHTTQPPGCSSNPSFQGSARPGEYYVLQLVVWAQAGALTDVGVEFEALKQAGGGGARLETQQMHSTNTEGVSYLGRPFRKQLNVSAGLLQPLYIGLDIPLNFSSSGSRSLLSGTFLITARSATTGALLPAVATTIKLSITGPPLVDHGDSDPSKLTRLRWLDSTEGYDNQPSVGFEGLRPVPSIHVSGPGFGSTPSTVALTANGKTFLIDTLTGLPASIRVNQLEILAQPVTFRVTVGRQQIAWCSVDGADGFRWTTQAPGLYEWQSRAVLCGMTRAGGGVLHLVVNGALHFDGYWDYNTELSCVCATDDAVGCTGGCIMETAALSINYTASATRFAMGLGNRAQPWPPVPGVWPIPPGPPPPTPSPPSPPPAPPPGPPTPPPAPPAPPACLYWPGSSRAQGTLVTFVYTNNDPNLCSFKQNGSTTLYSGTVCDHNGSILWSEISTEYGTYGANASNCAWNCTATPSNVYCATCGHRSPHSATVPTHLCSVNYAGATKSHKVSDAPPATGLHWKWVEAANASEHGVAPRMAWVAWVGSVDHGLRLKLKGPEAVWDGPLNPLGACDAGTHQCDGGTRVRIPDGWAHGSDAGLALGTDGVLAATMGARTISPGEAVRYRFDLTTTPAKRRDPKHWTRKYLMGCGGCDVAGAQMHPPLCKASPSNGGRMVENVTAMGFTTVTLHQGCPLNPYINWPFDPNITALLSDYSATRHAAKVGVQMYYTIRELSNRAVELPVLRSLGHEILVDGNTSAPGGIPSLPHGAGGTSWLQEHLRKHYKTGWTTDVRHNLTDAAVKNVGASRWSNYYVCGMKQLACFPPHVDGVELDGLSYPRHTTARMRKVTEQCRGAATVINEHVSDDFKGEGINGMLKYMEHFTFVDSLVTGEVFDYTGDPWYYLLEISGIPFGIMSDLWGWGPPPHGEPNLMYGMTVGMTARMPNGPGIVPVQATWDLWAAFDISSAEMLGWWDTRCPVRVRVLPDATTGHITSAPVKATAYVQKGNATFIALANWANQSTKISLEIDWLALELSAATTPICAPQVVALQRRAPDGSVPGPGLPVVADFGVGASIEVPAHSGWWLLLTTAARPILQCNGSKLSARPSHLNYYTSTV